MKSVRLNLYEGLKRVVFEELAPMSPDRKWLRFVCSNYVILNRQHPFVIMQNSSGVTDLTRLLWSD